MSETARRFRETARRFRETARRFRETDAGAGADDDDGDARLRLPNGAGAELTPGCSPLRTRLSHRTERRAQAQHCWTKYNEYVVCLLKTDDDEATCKKARQLALSICPNDWTTKWDEERANGNFAGVTAADLKPAAKKGH